MILRAEGLSRRFLRGSGQSNCFYAVEKAELSLRPGTITEITGRSGSGKTTLLTMLAGLLEPTEGRVLLGDVDLYSLGDAQRSELRNRCLGVIPQGQTGLHSLTVLENVTLPCQMYGEKPPVDEALSLLEQLGIAALRDAYPSELSGGELRRMAIARALIRRPPVLLADEPTGDLDDENIEAVLRLLRQRAADGAAVLLVTHEGAASAYADTIYRMSGGVLRLEGE